MLTEKSGSQTKIWYARGMKGDTHKAVRRGVGLTQQQYADLVGEARVTLSDQERGRYPVPRWSALMVSMFRDVPGALEYARAWEDPDPS